MEADANGWKSQAAMILCRLTAYISGRRKQSDEAQEAPLLAVRWM
jgi:hypothetical protein